MSKKPDDVCQDCSGEGEAPRSLLGACLTCPTCGGTGKRLRVVGVTHWRFTPGPWHVGQSGVTVFAQEGAVKITASVSGDGAPGLAERPHNARLIAAAPDLLAACEAALEIVHGVGSADGPVRKQLLAAVAKVQG